MFYQIYQVFDIQNHIYFALSCHTGYSNYQNHKSIVFQVLVVQEISADGLT